MQDIKTERGTIAGGISVLMIFLTLCITIYGLLALITAESELSLNLRNRDAAADYYAADALAVIIISELASADERVEVSVSETGDIPILYDPETDAASFTLPIDKYRNLDVSVSFPDGGNRYVIGRYIVVSSLDWQEQAGGNIAVITEFG